jgi:uncharacterized protein involved in response to NO
MTRASLGHTGHELTASRSTLAIYACVIIGAAARIAAAFGIEPQIMLHTAATAWILAFAGFAVMFGPMLLRPRSQG